MSISSSVSLEWPLLFVSHLYSTDGYITALENVELGESNELVYAQVRLCVTEYSAHRLYVLCNSVTAKQNSGNQTNGCCIWNPFGF